MYKETNIQTSTCLKQYAYESKHKHEMKQIKHVNTYVNICMHVCMYVCMYVYFCMPLLIGLVSNIFTYVRGALMYG